MTHVQGNTMTTASTRTAARARLARWRRASLLAACALVVAFVPGGRASAGAKAVPISGSISGTVAGIDAAHFAVAGVGVATHLGRIDYAGTVTVESIDSNNGTLTDSLIETLTAANGDTLTLLCHEVAPKVSEGVYHGTDHWTVLGGTGRFAGATGQGTADTDADLVTGIFSKRLTGQISY